MRCPNCHEEAETISQDPDFARAGLKGATVVIEVEQKELCGVCFSPVETKLYRMAADASDFLSEHQASGHSVQVHPKVIDGLNGDYSVGYTLVCTCGWNAKRTGIAEKVSTPTPESPAPWA